MVNNLFESLKSSFQNISTNFTVEIATYLFMGFLVGFLFKYTSKYLITIFIVASLSLWTLESLKVININYFYIKEILGLAVDVQASDILNCITSWVENHISQCLSSGLGFYLAIEFV